MLETLAVAPISIDNGGHRGRILAARDLLITTNLHLIRPIARRIKKRLPASFELDDLIGEGTVGLLRAADRYRPKDHNGCPFSAYARRRIHGAIIDSIRRRHYTESTRPGIEDMDVTSAAPLPAEAIDEMRQLDRLARAMGWLTGNQRRMLGRHYPAKAPPAPRARKRAAWIKRPNVIAFHARTIEELKTEYRRAA